LLPYADAPRFDPEEDAVNPREPMKSVRCVAWYPEANRWNRNGRMTWEGLGMLLAAIALRFGWVLPVARPVPVRVAERPHPHYLRVRRRRF
jgi:hypothetical protein